MSRPSHRFCIKTSSLTVIATARVTGKKWFQKRLLHRGLDWTGLVNMLSMVKMSSDGVVLVPASTHARLNWTERNREKAREEKQQQEKNELQRQAEKKEMWRKVGLNRFRR